MKIKQYLSTIILAILCMSTALFATLENQIALEQAYTTKVQHVLDGVYGKGNFIVRTSVKLTPAKYDVKYTKESNPTRSKKSKTTVNILPGYQVIKNLNPGGYNKLPFDSITTYLKPIVKSVTIDIIANKSLSQGKIGRAKNLAKKVLPIPERLITVNLSSLPFFKQGARSQDISIIDAPNALFSFKNVFSMLLLLLGL